MNGADLLVARLHHHGVRTVFGMPGSHSTAIYDALTRHGGFRTVLVRNEQAGAFLADGFARATGSPGVVCTTAGPGATNALTGIAEAWADSQPVLLVAGQTNHDRIHVECGNYHEIDLEGIFRPCTKVCGTAMAVDQIPGLVDHAFASMTTGRPRPAPLFLPQDLAAREVRDDHFAPPTAPDLDLGVPADAIARAAETLSRCVRPIVLAGGGAVSARATSELRAVAERLGAPVVTTLNGKGAVDERDPRSLGHARTAAGQTALAHADGMLAVGCRFTEVFTGFRSLRIPARLVQIDVDAGQIGVNHPVEVPIHADARLALRALLEVLPTKNSHAWAEPLSAARRAKTAEPEWLIHTLRAELPDNAVVFTDASEMAYRMHTDFAAYAPRTFFYPSNYIALGWGFPAALGAAVALPDRPIVSVSGDGGFLMTAQELATARRYQLQVIAIVHNDSTFGAIKNIQERRHESRFVDTDLTNPDFVRLALSFDVPAVRTPDARSFALAIRHAVNRRGPSLIEVPDDWRYLRS